MLIELSPMQGNQCRNSATEYLRDRRDNVRKGMWLMWGSLLTLVLVLSTQKCVVWACLPYMQCEMQYWQEEEFQANLQYSCKNGQRQTSNKVCGFVSPPVGTCPSPIMNTQALQSSRIDEIANDAGMQGGRSSGKRTGWGSPSKRKCTTPKVRARAWCGVGERTGNVGELHGN